MQTSEGLKLDLGLYASFFFVDHFVVSVGGFALWSSSQFLQYCHFASEEQHKELAGDFELPLCVSWIQDATAEPR